ncbi:hypothetical protein INS49_003182 [Diaporthe citri]|uniref:uncharacterized protein n=1 Tax=Diaporthe citri TaxID=83186 RepID=UPI001C7E7FE0|nr:uncharacterized protein INS49_003182 [Diaporthe citri]KAG6368963.1 hypothetical protein INS49_003182 [Diaporthe citri]
MSSHESFFSYNTTRPYPFRWFTPVVIGGGIVVTALVSFLNVAASGYELAAISTTDPNKVRSGAEWFDSWPKWLASTRASCDPTTIPLQTGLYTNNTATLLQYRVASVSTYDVPGSDNKTILGSLVYDNNPLSRCNVTSVLISIEANDRPAAHVSESSVGTVLTANVECLLESHGKPTTYLELVTTFGANRSPSVSISLGHASGGLWLGTSLLMWYSDELAKKYYLENVNLDTPFFKAEALLSRTAGYRTSRPATMDQIMDMDFLQMDSCWLMPLNSTGISHANNYCDSHTISELSQGSTEQKPLASIWEPLSWLGKAMWFTVLADLGRDDELLPNILSRPSLLGNLTNNTSLPADVDDFAITPSAFATTYICQVPRLKSTGTLLVSVLVADLVLLQAIWKLFVLAMNYFMTLNKDEMQYCIAANVVVLLSSNGAKVDTWTRGGVQPSTFLSISAVISNLCLALVYNQGLAQAFWIRSLRGSSIEGLHHQWDAGQSSFGAVRALAAGQGIASACAMLAVALSALRSPLNQAAVRVVQGNLTSQGTLDVQVAQKLPDNHTAYGVSGTQYGNSSKASAYLTESFDAIVLGYNNRATMKLRHTECGDSCETAISGFGFDADCTTVSQDGLFSDPSGETIVMFSADVNIWAQNLSDAYQGSGSNSSTSSKRESDVDTSTPYETWDTAVYNAGLNISIFFRQADGPYPTFRNCLLQPSVMAYPVTLTNDSTVTLNGAWSTDKKIKTVNYTGPFFYQVDSATEIVYHSSHITTVGGFQYAGSTLFKSSAIFNGSMPIFDGLLSNLYFNGSSKSWSDPTDDILNAFRELSFRTSTIKALYLMDWRYMVGGLVVSLLAALSVLPLFYGFWHLGREVSMNPFEIAMAFDSPLLADARPHCGAGDVVKQIGNKHIMYGACTTQEPSSPLRLRFGMSGDS